MALSMVLLMVACGGRSPEAVAAEQVIEVDLADEIGLVLDAECADPASTEIRCTAATPDGATVVIVGDVGADDLRLRAVNVITDAEMLEAAFAASGAITSLPTGRLSCPSPPIVASPSGALTCPFVAASGHEAAIDITIEEDGAIRFEARLPANIAAEAAIEHDVLPEFGLGSGVVSCDPSDGAPFTCEALLDDGRRLGFVAEPTGTGVDIAAANVLGADDLARLEAAFREAATEAGVAVEGLVLDCGAETVVLDESGVLNCVASAPGQNPVDVVVTVSELGTPEVGFRFDFSVQTNQGGGASGSTP